MKVLSGPYSAWERIEHPTAITVGVFDGVHRGHQYLLRQLVDHAAGLPVCVVTFRQHPAELVMPARAPQMLTTLERRLDLLETHGADIVAVLEFDESIRHAGPEDFVLDILVERLHAGWVSVGRQFRFGYQLVGDVELLAELGRRYGFEVEPIEIFGGDEPIRSTTIRARLEAGDVRAAAGMLGRPFRLTGRVVPGDKRGRLIGFPTANLAVDPRLARPASGVYAAMAGIDEPARAAVVNIGNRPTFSGDRELVEVHLIDVDEDLYDRDLSIEFVDRIRDEMKFGGIPDLSAQIRRDIEVGRSILRAK